MMTKQLYKIFVKDELLIPGHFCIHTIKDFQKYLSHTFLDIF